MKLLTLNLLLAATLATPMAFADPTQQASEDVNDIVHTVDPSILLRQAEEENKGDEYRYKRAEEPNQRIGTKSKTTVSVRPFFRKRWMQRRMTPYEREQYKIDGGTGYVPSHADQLFDRQTGIVLDVNGVK